MLKGFQSQKLVALSFISLNNNLYKGLKWTLDSNQTLGPSCIYHSANVLGDKMYVFGGVNNAGQPTNDLYEYSLGSNFLMNWSNGDL